MQTFPIFVINLPTATERRESIERQLRAMGAQFEFMDGIFGNDGRVTARYDEQLAIKERGKPMTIGERGCALAHALVHERMLREQIPVALILEDDMVLPPDFIERAEREVARQGRAWDWLSFDYRYVGWPYLQNWLIATMKTIRMKPSFIFYAFLKLFYIPPLALFEGIRDRLAHSFATQSGAKRFYRPLYNAGAYLLTYEGAVKLQQLTDPLRFPADEVQNVASRRSDFKLYGYVPLIVRQDLERFWTDAGLSNEEWEQIFASRQNL